MRSNLYRPLTRLRQVIPTWHSWEIITRKCIVLSALSSLSQLEVSWRLHSHSFPQFWLVFTSFILYYDCRSPSAAGEMQSHPMLNPCTNLLANLELSDIIIWRDHSALRGDHEKWVFFCDRICSWLSRICRLRLHKEDSAQYYTNTANKSNECHSALRMVVKHIW